MNIFILMSHEIKYDDTKLANCLQTQIDNNNTTPTEYKIRFRRLILILMCAPKEIITVFPDPLARLEDMKILFQSCRHIKKTEDPR